MADRPELPPWAEKEDLRAIEAQINEARRMVMSLYGGNLDHPALDHLELAMAEVVDVDRRLRRG